MYLFFSHLDTGLGLVLITDASHMGLEAYAYLGDI
jgi:hypothetical protein